MEKIVNVINDGGIVIMPTDTIYGIIGLATDEAVIKKVFSLKNRNDRKPMLVLVDSIDMLKEYTKNINKKEQKLIDNFWPGPLTIIFEKNNLSDLLTGGLPTVGVRMPDNDMLLKLINEVGKPLLSTSVNVSGKKAAISIDCIDENILNEVDLVIDEGEMNDVPSTIVRAFSGEVEVIREGVIKKEEILKIFNT